MTTPDSADAPSARSAPPQPVTVERVRSVHLSEDWLATIVGLALVALGIAGLIPAGLVP
ncbi:MAG: hypothetical protein ACTMIR_02145 [Cellulomonadaceae bacterium]